MSVEDELLEAFPGSELSDDAELALYRARAQALLDELDVGSTSVRLEMLADPERACLVLENARSASGLRNRAGYAVKRWRSGWDPRRARQATARTELPPESPPTLSAIEQAWSLEDEAGISDYVARIMAAAISRTGGFRPVLEQGFNVRERYDVDGELVERIVDR